METGKYIDSGLVKSRGTDVDKQILNFLGCGYKWQKKGSVRHYLFVSLVFEISTSAWDKLTMGLAWEVI